MKTKSKVIGAFMLIISIIIGSFIYPITTIPLNAATNDNELIIYPEFPPEIERDYAYSVSVSQGSRTESIPVYNHTMESTISRNSDGYDNYRRFSCFAFQGSQVRVDIKVNFDFTEYSVMPSAKNFNHSYSNGVISVYLDNPEYFLIRLNNSDNTILSIFADAPEDLSDTDFNDPNTKVITGWHEPSDGTGMIELAEDNSTLYIAPGAVLNARVNVTGDNVRITGRGAIVDPYEDIYNYNIRVGGTDGEGTKLINFKDTQGSVAEGVLLLDARCFNIAVSGWRVENITVGTTCATMFPQGNPTNISLEDIHIFRSDDEICNQSFAAGDDSTSVIVNRLDSVDCTYMPHIFKGRNVGTSVKTFGLNNISLGDTTTHCTGTMISFTNPGGEIHSDNWKLDFNNLSLGGLIITNANQLTRVDEGSNNEIIISSEGNFIPVTHNKTTVSYVEPNKVFVGAWQVLFEKPYFVENGNFLLPYDEIRRELRTLREGTTQERDGIKYISSADLVSCGLAKEVSIVEDSLIITPLNEGYDLLTEDSGELSKFTERDVSKLYLYTISTDEGWIYTIDNYKNGINAGFQRIINEDLYKYGTGKYIITFEAKASEIGELGVWLETKSHGTEKESKPVGTDWNTYEFMFDINESKLTDKNIVFIIQSSGASLSEFSIRNVSMHKYEFVDGAYVIPIPEPIVSEEPTPTATPTPE